MEKLEAMTRLFLPKKTEEYLEAVSNLEIVGICGHVVHCSSVRTAAHSQNDWSSPLLSWVLEIS